MNEPALHTFAYSDPVRQWIDPHECGWQDGGCFIFAVALCLWLAPDAEPACLYRASLIDEQTADHWVCSIGGIFIDSDGVYDAAGLLSRWSHSRLLNEPMVLELPAPESRAVDVLKDTGVSREIARLLSIRFGRPAHDQLLAVLGAGIQD